MADRYWVGGTGSWAATTTNWSATSGGLGGASVPTLNDDVFFTNLSSVVGYTCTLTTAPVCRSVTIDPPLTGNITLAGSAAWSIYGNLTIASTGVTRTFTSTITFAATTSSTITTNGVALASAILFTGVGGSWTLGSALTTTLSANLTRGTLDLNNFNLTCQLFNTNNANTRTLAFGTGQIYLTGNAVTIWTFNNATNLTITGSAIVNATYSGSTGNRGISGYGTGTALINLNITAGSDTVSSSNNGYNNINFTGFTGATTVSSTNILGNCTFNSGMTVSVTSGNLGFGGSTTQLITSNEVIIEGAVLFGGASEKRLQDNLNLGLTRNLLLNGGIFNLNGKRVTTGTMASSGTGVRSVAFNGGTIVVTGASFSVSGSNYSTTGSGTISMTSASSKTFAGNNVSFPTLNQGGAGALTITGANTFADITNTVQPATVTFPANITTTFSDFNLNGTIGNLVTINSSIAGTQATINYVGSSTVNVNFLSIRDSNATPGIATWYAGDTSVNVSNNNGWFFVVQPTLFDTHDGGDRKRDAKKRKTEAAKAKARRDEVLKLFERIVEGKPEVAEEIAEPFVIIQATIQAPAVIDYDAMLASFDRVEQIYNAYIEMDDEDVLLLL